MADLVTPIVEVAFAFVEEPRENLSGQLEWTIGVKLKEEDSTPIFDEIEKEIKDKQKENKFPRNLEGLKLNYPYRPSMQKQEDGSKVPVEGELLWIFKRKVARKSRGEEVRNAPPVIYDGTGAIVKNPPSIGSGSKVRVGYTAYAYDNVQRGVQFQLHCVQIVELKEFSRSEMEAVEGGWVAPKGDNEGSFESLFAGAEVA